MPDAIVERDGHLLVVTLNRPARMNALSGEMLVRMHDAWVQASTDDDIRCILLTGAGGNFCSGADLRAMAGDAGHSDGEAAAGGCHGAVHTRSPWRTATDFCIAAVR